jgi:hypothetical protein
MMSLALRFRAFAGRGECDQRLLAAVETHPGAVLNNLSMAGLAPLSKIAALKHDRMHADALDVEQGSRRWRQINTYP